jgi:hypothetical protein
MDAVNIDNKKAEKLIILIGIGFCVALAITLNLNQAMLYRSDLLPRWYATNQLLANGRSLYDPQNGQELFQSYAPDILSPEDANFFYPAHILIITIGLALIPYVGAHLLWTLLSLFFYLASIWLAMKIFRLPITLKRRVGVIAMAILFIPALQEIIWTQFNTLGLFSMVLAVYALQREKYTLAGVLSAGMTFKPQALLLTLLFLIFWALFDRARWKFLFGFTTTMIGLLAVAFIAQPGWLGEFIHAIDTYRHLPYFEVKSVLDHLWNPYQLLAGTNLLSAIYLFSKNRHAPSDHPAFAGCLGLSIAVWFLVVPVIGTIHLVALPVAALLVLWSLREMHHPFYWFASISCLILYLMGWAGFLIGLMTPGIGNLHIALLELIYKGIAPVTIAMLALVALRRNTIQERRAIQATPIAN